MGGMLAMGYFSDKYHSRAVFAMFLGINGVLYLIAYFFSPTSLTFWYVVIICSMFLLGGP